MKINLNNRDLQNSPTALADDVLRACIPSIASYVWLKNEPIAQTIHTHLGTVHEIQISVNLFL